MNYVQATDPELRGELCGGRHGLGGHREERLGLGGPVRAGGGSAGERDDMGDEGVKCCTRCGQPRLILK